jgi:hypothetical protein
MYTAQRLTTYVLKNVSNMHTNLLAVAKHAIAEYCSSGVAQWTSHPPQEQEDPGSNPARV